MLLHSVSNRMSKRKQHNFLNHVQLLKFSQLFMVVQIKDVFDNDLFIVGPYDWRNCTHLTRYINYPDEFFLQVNLC